MPRLSPVRWQVLKCIFEKNGFRFERESGDHIVLSKEGVLRPVIIPKYKSIGVDIIRSNMRTANMTRDKYFQYLNEC